MINEKELRRGNLIFGVSDRVEKVVAIRKGFITASTPILGDDAMEFESKYFSPIELAEEYLNRFGFENDDDDFLISITDETVLHINLNKRRILLESYDGVILLPHIKFEVHSIQNLYWVLTGKELKYTI